MVFWWEVGLAAVEVFLGRLKAEHVFCVQVDTHAVGVLAVVRTHLSRWLMVVDGWGIGRPWVVEDGWVVKCRVGGGERSGRRQ